MGKKIIKVEEIEQEWGIDEMPSEDYGLPITKPIKERLNNARRLFKKRRKLE